MLRRLVNWLLGIPPKERLDAARNVDADRDTNRTRAIEAADRANLAGGPRRPGPGQDLGGLSG